MTVGLHTRVVRLRSCGAAACRHSLKAEPWPGELGLHSLSRWFTIRALRSVYVFGTPLLDDYVSPLEVVGCYF